MWSWFTNGNTDIDDGDSFAEGIGQNRVTKNIEGLAVERAYRIPDQAALTIVYQLLREEGLFLGLSSGINVAGAVRLRRGKRPRPDHRHHPLRLRAQVSVEAFQSRVARGERTEGGFVRRYPFRQALIPEPKGPVCAARGYQLQPCDGVHTWRSASPIPSRPYWTSMSIQDIDDRAESRTYIVSDHDSGKAVIIDAVIENVDRDLTIIKELGLILTFAVETHIHADHITGASMIRDRTGAKIVYGGGVEGLVTGADMFLHDGQELRFGNTTMKALATPGHTDSCTSYVMPGTVFTGDCLLIRGNGRTDFQGGSAEKLFDSVRKKLFALPDDTIVYPGHDYNGRVSSTIGEEKQFNEHLNLSINRQKFVEIMKGRKLPSPVKMDVALIANLKAGRIAEEEKELRRGSIASSGSSLPTTETLDV